jgi:hypothetical protein
MVDCRAAEEWGMVLMRPGFMRRVTSEDDFGELT